jgi:hypothetical protein
MDIMLKSMISWIETLYGLSIGNFGNTYPASFPFKKENYTGDQSLK